MSPSPSPDVQALALQMLQAQDDVQQVPPITSRFPGFDLAAAYAVSRRIHETRCKHGARPVGRKIGFTNPAMWKQYGVEGPVWAHVYEHTVHDVRDGLAVYPIGRFAEPKIEPEIVVHFRAAPPASSDPAAILACVDWVALGFELVQSHFPGWQFRAPDTVADSALHGALVVGAPRPVDGLGADPVGALASFELELFCDGQRRERGRGSNVLGSPLAAIAHLIGVLSEQPQAAPLQAGEIVTTGTLTPALPIRAGERWRAEVRGIPLPEVEISLVD